MNSYKSLNKQTFSEGQYSIVPIRFEDRLAIMNWRNEQIYHLRQHKILTESDQTNYFNTVVNKLFDKEFPEQLLFSFLENSTCIGYGGLVHINWIDKHAEISFIMNTTLEKDHFQSYWGLFLNLIEDVAFNELKLHKIFTYAFDLRPHLYKAIEEAGFKKEATLKEHCFFNNEYKDVIIHSKKENDRFELRLATINDSQLLFDWSNDALVRKNSLNSELIKWEDHVLWLTNKLQSNSKILILLEKKEPIGVLRFDQKEDHFLINYSISEKYRGKGYGNKIIELGIKHIGSDKPLKAIVKKENISSIKIFEKLNFEKNTEADDSIFCFTKQT